jgi:hypothetical protein
MDPLAHRVVARFLSADAHLWTQAQADLRVFNERYAEAQHLKEPLDNTGEKLLNDFAFRKNGTAPSFVDTGFQKWASYAFGVADIDDPDAYRPMGVDILKVVDGKRPLREFLHDLDRYKDALQAVLHATAPTNFEYQGFKITNPEHIGDTQARRMLEGVDYVAALFKTRGLDHLLRQGLTSIDLALDLGGNTHGLYHSNTRHISLSAKAIAGSGRTSLKWINEVFLHEFGHFVHLHYLSKDAKEVWDHGWAEVHQKRQEVDTLFKNISQGERQRFFDLVKASNWDVGSASKKLKGVDKVKFGVWLRTPMVGDPLITDKQFRLTMQGKITFTFLKDPDKFIADNYQMEPGTEKHKRQAQLLQKRALDKLGLLWGGNYHVPTAVVDEMAKADPEMNKAVEEAMAKLEIVTDYGKTNEKEDFAESFVAFVGAPSQLTPTAKFRMQQALALSGLYGKHVMHLASTGDFLLMAEALREDLCAVPYSYQRSSSSAATP